MPGERDRSAAPIPPKLLAGARLKLRVAAASAAILGAGALLAPRAAPTAVPVSEERAVPLLQEEVQRREPARQFRGLRQEIIRRVGSYSVEIPGRVNADGPRTTPDAPPLPVPPRAASGYGVVVDAAGGVLTHVAALAGRMTLPVRAPDGSPAEARVAAHETQTGLALLRVSGAPTLAAPISAASLEPGALAAAVVRRDGRDVASPVFVTAADDSLYSIAPPGAPLAAGTPLYNLDGEAFAIAAGPGAGDVAYPLAGTLGRLQARESSGHPFDGSIGISIQGTAGLTRWFPAAGALVSAVVPGGPAAAAGIAPGDVLIRIDEAPVDSPAAAQKAIASMAPGSRHAITVLRDKRTVSLDTTAGSAFELAHRRTPEPPLGTHPPAAAVLAPDVMDASRIPGNALLLELNGRSVPSRDAALRELRRLHGAALVYMQHEGERFFAALEAPR